jgi:hypothetical protein
LRVATGSRRRGFMSSERRLGISNQTVDNSACPLLHW